MLPEAVWSMPRFGTLNLHASLLPQYRGAAPINRAVMNGDTKSGVTTFFLRHDIDTGNIAMQQSVEIGPEETAGELYDELMTVGADLLLKTVDAVIDGTVKSIPQSENKSGRRTSACPENIHRDLQNRLEQKRNRDTQLHTRTCPHPTAWTEVEHHGTKYTMKIYGAHLVCNEKPLQEVGTFLWFRTTKNTCMLRQRTGISTLRSCNFRERNAWRQTYSSTDSIRPRT